MPKKATDPDDIEAFAAAPRQTARRCETCRDYPEVAEDVRKFLKIKLGKGSRRSNAELFELMQRKHGYKLGHSAFEAHIRNCEKGLRDEIRKRGL